MTQHDYNGYSWTECDDCGEILRGQKPDYVGGHFVKASYNRCKQCEVFKTYDSNGKVIKYKGK